MVAAVHTLVQSWETRRRRVVVALGAIAVAAIGGSWFLPWWTFTLVSPQYPKGLHLIVSLTGVGGDIKEIDTINHYIGMHSLADAAQIERAASSWLVATIAVAAFAALLLVGRKIGWLGLAVGLGLPLGFVVDSAYWMYHSGHDLDPHAPIHMTPFTPTMLGTGKVGQFVTSAFPSLGFYAAVVGVALLGVAVWQRARVCRVCPAAGQCSAVCPHKFIAAPS